MPPVDKTLASRYGTPLESPGFLLWHVSNRWQRQQRHALRDLGLTQVQFVLLAGIAWLGRNRQPVTQTQLAQHAQTDPMMTSQVVRTLESKGLIERKPLPRDTRAKSLRVTPRGRKLARQAMVLVEQTGAAFFAALDESPTHLVNLLRQLLGTGDAPATDDR